MIWRGRIKSLHLSPIWKLTQKKNVLRFHFRLAPRNLIWFFFFCSQIFMGYLEGTPVPGTPFRGGGTGSAPTFWDNQKCAIFFLAEKCLLYIYSLVPPSLKKCHRDRNWVPFSLVKTKHNKTTNRTLEQARTYGASMAERFSKGGGHYGHPISITGGTFSASGGTRLKGHSILITGGIFSE